MRKLITKPLEGSFTLVMGYTRVLHKCIRRTKAAGKIECYILESCESPRFKSIIYCQKLFKTWADYDDSVKGFDSYGESVEWLENKYVELVNKAKEGTK